MTGSAEIAHKGTELQSYIATGYINGPTRFLQPLLAWGPLHALAQAQDLIPAADRSVSWTITITDHETARRVLTVQTEPEGK